MTLVLDLNPGVERELQASAARDGVPPDKLAQRLLASALRRKKTFEEMQAQAVAGFAASGITEEELEDYISDSVRQVRIEMREAELISLL